MLVAMASGIGVLVGHAIMGNLVGLVIFTSAAWILGRAANAIRSQYVPENQNRT